MELLRRVGGRGGKGVSPPLVIEPFYKSAMVQWKFVGGKGQTRDSENKKKRERGRKKRRECFHLLSLIFV